MPTLEEMNAHKEKMEKAFHLVDPSVGGKVPGMSWKDAINTSATQDLWDRLCAWQGVTFEDVLDSIRFFTATEPQVIKCAVPTDVGVGQPDPRAVLVTVKSMGYRAGPAGP